VRVSTILFDLFGTLLFVDGDKLPHAELDGKRVIMTIPGIDELLAQLTPQVSLDRFFECLVEVSVEMGKEKRRTHREIPSVDRFTRTLRALELDGDIDVVAQAMSRRHMGSLAAAVTCPDDRVALLTELADRYRIGLISNFDHGLTARALLAHHGLNELFETIVISDDAGVCKPGAAIFARACTDLGVELGECLYVGDSHDADVHGATGAGLHALWVDSSDDPHAPALGKIGDVRELPGWLEAEVGVEGADG